MRALGLCVLLALALPAVPAAAKAPRAVTPAAAVTTASVSGARLTTTITVSFAVPARTSARKACTGTVRGTTKLTARTRRTLSGALGVSGARCRASLRGSLPKAFLGATKAFKLTFAGNTAVKPFATTTKLKLVPPPTAPVPAPVTQPTTTTPAPTTTPPVTPPTGPPATSFFDPAYKGTWGTDPPTTGVNDQWVITVSSSGVVGLSSFGSFKWLCGALDDLTQANWNLVYQDTGSFIAANHAEDTAVNISGNTNTTVHWTLDFDGPSLGTGHGTMSASGQYDYGLDGVKSCHMTAGFTFYRSGT